MFIHQHFCDVFIFQLDAASLLTRGRVLKATRRFLMFVCPSPRTWRGNSHDTEFREISYFGIIVKTGQRITILLKIGQKKNALDVMPNARLWCRHGIYNRDRLCSLWGTNWDQNKIVVTETAYVLRGVPAEAAETVEH